MKTLNQKLKKVYNEMPRINYDEISERFKNVSFTDSIKSKEYLRMMIGDIISTINCEGSNYKLQNDLEYYVNKYISI